MAHFVVTPKQWEKLNKDSKPRHMTDLENKMLYELYDKISPGWRNSSKVQKILKSNNK